MSRYNYTVIIPHRNTPDLLERCLKSIPERADIQVLVVDDNSDEQYMSSVREACAGRSNVQLIETHEGLGAGYARNVALVQADSKWLLFADADDYFLPDAWQHFDGHIDDSEDVIFFCCTCCYSDTHEPGDRHLRVDKKVVDYLAHPDSTTEGLLRYSNPEPIAKMVRAEMVRDNHLQFEQTRWGNDVHFSTMVGVCAHSVAAYTDEVYCITIAHGSLVHQHTLESRRCRYEVLLRNNTYLREQGLPEFQESLMYSLRWAAKLGGLKAVCEFIRIGRQHDANFWHGASKWITNYFVSNKEYKHKDKYIVKQ